MTFATCSFCKQKMNVNSCKARIIEFPDGVMLPASTDHFDEPSGRCHDCGIAHGGYHHPGCDAERCPRCFGQLISCGCFEASR